MSAPIGVILRLPAACAREILCILQLTARRRSVHATLIGTHCTKLRMGTFRCLVFPAKQQEHMIGYCSEGASATDIVGSQTCQPPDLDKLRALSAGSQYQHNLVLPDCNSSLA
jgi:hypothetical protein